MKALYGLYRDPESAQRAVDALRRGAPGLQVSERDILIASSEPFAEYEFGHRDHRTFMPWLTALGGLIGGLGGYLLVSFTQNSYPLPTGGMKIVPPWPDGVITYECTMLGAILCTLITLLTTARSPRATARVYDPQVADGKILIGVADPPRSARAGFAKVLRASGASEVRQFDHGKPMPFDLQDERNTP